MANIESPQWICLLCGHIYKSKAEAYSCTCKGSRILKGLDLREVAPDYVHTQQILFKEEKVEQRGENP